MMMWMTNNKWTLIRHQWVAGRDDARINSWSLGQRPYKTQIMIWKLHRRTK